MNIYSFIVLALVILAFGGAIASIVIRKRKGKGCCSCGCSGCTMNCSKRK
ncbi:MAG: FeoB-associated Cys-rich membrane protein [Sphaerochaetaceae bacterium]|nr:FeoB-associated Cys-rich membrane protein [Sphaerochaetaceae bacterium]